MINHITYQLTPEGIAREPRSDDGLGRLMAGLGFREVEPDDPFEHGYDVRWFKKAGCPVVHFVAQDGAEWVELGLGHFCVVAGEPRFSLLRDSEFLTRDSGSGRIWLTWDNVRVEVRP